MHRYLGMGMGLLIPLHLLDQALRSHIRPMLLDVVQAGASSLRAVHDRPAGRHVGEGGPQRMLALIIDQGVESPVLVVEGLVDMARTLLPSADLKWRRVIKPSVG